MSLYDIKINCENDESKEVIVYDIRLARNNIMFCCIFKDVKELIDPCKLCEKIEAGIKDLFEVHEQYFSIEKRLERFFRKIKGFLKFW